MIYKCWVKKNGFSKVLWESCTFYIVKETKKSNNGRLFSAKKANETKTIRTCHSSYSSKKNNNLSQDKDVGRNDYLSFIFYHSKDNNAEYFVWGLSSLLVCWRNKNAKRAMINAHKREKNWRSDKEFCNKR